MLETAASLVVFAVAVASVAGYLAWAVGTRTTGLPMVKMRPEDLVSLGGLSLVMGIAWFGAALTGSHTERKGRYSPRSGLVVAAIVGAGFSAAVLVSMAGFAVVQSQGLVILVAIVGAAMPPSIMAVAWMLNSRNWPTRPPTWHTREGKTWISALIVLSVLWGGVASGLVLVPEVPASVGGLHPSPAAIYWEPGASQEDLLGGTNESGAIVWVFRITEGEVLVRAGCEDARAGRAFTIPLDRIQAIQWITEPTRESRCKLG